MKLRIDINVSINRIARSLILVDLFLFGGWGFVQPIFSIFILRNIKGATLITVGISGGLYWILKSLVQLPVATYLDKHKGEKDDFYTLLMSLLLLGVIAFWYPFITSSWQLYLLQIVFAIGFGLYTPAWAGIFSRHLDSERHAFDYSLDSTFLGIAAGVSGALGGVIAEMFGFPSIFILAGVFSILSAMVLFWIPELVFPQAPHEPVPSNLKTQKTLP